MEYIGVDVEYEVLVAGCRRWEAGRAAALGGVVATADVKLGWSDASAIATTLTSVVEGV